MSTWTKLLRKKRDTVWKIVFGILLLGMIVSATAFLFKL